MSENRTSHAEAAAQPRRIPLFPMAFLANRGFLTYFGVAAAAQIAFGVLFCFMDVLVLRPYARGAHELLLLSYAFTSGGTGGLIYYRVQSALFEAYGLGSDQWNNKQTELCYGAVTLTQVVVVALLFAFLCWRSRGINKSLIAFFFAFMLLNVPFGVILLIANIV